MFSKLIKQGNSTDRIPKEGDLYKEVTAFGRTFRIHYGYYEEFEREGKYNDPMPIYPDLLNFPVYTEDGKPFVTAIQDVCDHYFGVPSAEEVGCSDCRYFKLCEDLIGICTCSLKKRDAAGSDDHQQE